MERKPYSTNISDDKWAFVMPYLTLMTEDAPQRDYPLLEVFNGLRYVVRGGTLAYDPERFAALGDRVSANATLVERGCFDWRMDGTHNLPEGISYIM